jgi:hypothetical protein
LSINEWVVNDRREEIYRLHNRAILTDAIHSGIIGSSSTDK